MTNNLSPERITKAIQWNESPVHGPQYDREIQDTIRAALEQQTAGISNDPDTVFIHRNAADAIFDTRPAIPEGMVLVKQVYVDNVAELLEVAALRGDDELPHPTDDPKLWTARMQDAWYELRHEHDEMIAAAQKEGKK